MFAYGWKMRSVTAHVSVPAIMAAVACMALIGGPAAAADPVPQPSNFSPASHTATVTTSESADPVPSPEQTASSSPGVRVADFAAIGDTVSGTTGQILTVHIGVINHGPSGAYRPFFTLGWVFATLPAGVSLVNPSHQCRVEPTTGLPRCDFPIPRALDAGQTMMFGVQIRIDRSLRNATGAVSVLNDGDIPDTNATNDRATIIINPTNNGDLPVTGASTGALASAGAVLLVVGALAYVLGRRRRAAME